MFLPIFQLLFKVTLVQESDGLSIASRNSEQTQRMFGQRSITPIYVTWRTFEEHRFRIFLASWIKIAKERVEIFQFHNLLPVADISKQKLFHALYLTCTYKFVLRNNLHRIFSILTTVFSQVKREFIIMTTCKLSKHIFFLKDSNFSDKKYHFLIYM